jgi:chaperonin GroES
MEVVMSISLKPLGSRVVVEPVESEEVTAGGIVLPETAKEKPQKGKILSIGPGDRDDDGKRIPMDVSPGDGPVRRTPAPRSRSKARNCSS